MIQDPNVWARSKRGLSILNPFPVQRRHTKELVNNQKQHYLHERSRLRGASQATVSLARTKRGAEITTKRQSTYFNVTDAFNEPSAANLGAQDN